MIFLFPLLFIIFILLLIMKLAGAHLDWGWVVLPGVLFIIAIIAFIINGICASRHKKKTPHG